MNLFRHPVSRLMLLMATVLVFGVRVSALPASANVSTLFAAMPSIYLPAQIYSSPEKIKPAPIASSSTANTQNIFLPLLMRSAPASSIYWGALVGGEYPSNTNMQPGGVYDTFETMVGKRMSILHWGASWKTNGIYLAFDTQSFDNVRAHGSIPLFSWGSRDSYGGVDQPDFQLSAIYNGLHDNFIRQWALSAKAWGHPFFLRLDWEMNGYWQFPWSEQLNGNQPGDYVKAWRHVHDIFAQAGATNVTWVWCPNIADPSTTPMSELYPGDGYVDWTCLDGYNKYNVWLGLDTILTGDGITWLLDSYNQISAVAPAKPLMIGETASLEAGDGGALKATWITDAYTVQLPKNFPRIKAIVWFDWNDGNPAYTFPIDSSQLSINAFVGAIGSSYYATNSFSNLTSSPISPPP